MTKGKLTRVKVSSILGKYIHDLKNSNNYSPEYKRPSLRIKKVQVSKKWIISMNRQFAEKDVKMAETLRRTLVLHSTLVLTLVLSR